LANSVIPQTSSPLLASSSAVLRWLALLGSLAGVLGLALGCSSDPMMGGGSGSGGGGGGGMSGGGTGGGPPIEDPGPAPSTCSPTASTMGMVTTPSPLISVGKRATGSAGVRDPGRAVDGAYPRNGAYIPAASLPGWVAIEVAAAPAAGPTRLMLTWADAGWTDYNKVADGGGPVDYVVETSADSTTGADGTWEMVAAVTANVVRERAHTFAFAGKSWVRMKVTAGTKDSAGMNAGVALDEIALYDVSQVGQGRPADSWFFMGDSITAGAFKRQLGAGTSFDAQVKAARPTFQPIMLNGGIGGELSAAGKQHIDDWLRFNPDFQHVAIMYGTNDSWGNKIPTPDFATNLNTIVDKVLAEGRVPILARIPFAAYQHKTLPPWNEVIDSITAAKGLPCGPDFYTWFRDHPEDLSPDGVHPSDAGYRSMNRLWAETVIHLYP
jgi:acyl-CoA thioesterase I